MWNKIKYGLLPIVLGIGLVFSMFASCENEKRDTAKRIQIENQIKQYEKRIDSLIVINQQLDSTIAFFNQEVLKLEQNLIKSENDKKKLQSNLNNFKIAVGFSEGVETLKRNLKHETDTVITFTFPR